MREPGARYGGVDGTCRPQKGPRTSPIWTESGYKPRIPSMLDWTDRSPDATFDLHGQSVVEAVANAERFLRAQARARPGGIVRLITGRGRGGGGAPIRTRVRALLRTLKESGSVVRDYMLEETEGSYLARLVG